MEKFKPLSPIMEPYYSLDFEQLPQGIQKRVLEAFFPIPWNRLSAEQRQRLSESWDYANDPATEPERQRAEKVIVELNAVEQQIAQWRRVETPTAQDLSIQEQRLKELKQQHGELEKLLERLQTDALNLSASDVLEPTETGAEKLDRRERKTLLAIIHLLAVLKDIKPIPAREGTDGWHRTATALLKEATKEHGFDGQITVKILARKLREAFRPR